MNSSRTMMAPMFTVQITEATGHLSSAEAFAKDVCILAASPNHSYRLFAVGVGQALESGLKAFLLSKLKPQDVNPGGHHNISRLWELSHIHGLPIPKAMPMWVDITAQGHDEPYWFRYQQTKLTERVGALAKGTIVPVHGMQMPPPNIVVDELPKLLLMIRTNMA